MCGIAGFINTTDHQSDDELRSIAITMNRMIAHRGPDQEGIWTSSENQIGLAHSRLSIQDLSAAGTQPMTSHCQRYIMVYNGEVYNGENIKQGIERNWRGHSDSEAILESFARIGIEPTLQKMVGMFAIALWDSLEKRLFLIRDRLGIKPLYWGQHQGTLLFGSELKALTSHPRFVNEIDRNSVASFLRHNYVPGPHSIYQGIQKLQPGQILTFKAGEDPKIKAYWDLDRVIENADPWQGSEDEAIDALDSLLTTAVSQRMLSDVPLGAFLSGGIDSSCVAALMQKSSAKPIRTFSIGFHETAYNEAQHAALVAQHLGTNHTELYVSPEEARDVIPKLPDIYDEPFADSSQIPTFLLSQITKQHVSVSLSGDGGDELFSGYTRYTMAKKYRKLIYNQPKLLRNFAAASIHTLSPKQWDKVGHLIPKSKRPTLLGDKLYKLSNILRSEEDDYYLNLISQCQNPNSMACHAQEHRGIIHDKTLSGCIPDFIDQMQYLDVKTYLPDDILTKVDRASMAVALEARVPLLDHRVLEFAWSLPQNLKIQNNQSKWILRQVLDRYVPRKIIERPKMGFGVPIDDWLRGPLKEWANDLLSENQINKYGLLYAAPIQQKWQEHLSGSRNWQYHLWGILMLQSWCMRWQNK